MEPEHKGGKPLLPILKFMVRLSKGSNLCIPDENLTLYLLCYAEQLIL